MEPLNVPALYAFSMYMFRNRKIMFLSLYSCLHIIYCKSTFIFF